MTEMAKTLTFVAVAALSLVAAFVLQPRTEEFDVQSKIGEKLNQFDVDDAKRLRIVTFDQETASTHEFEVAEENGLWTIPSKQGYPADAIRQMGAAATCLINREVLRIAAENAAQHAELGLVDPTSSNLDIKAEGVGIRVAMTDIDGTPLADMIIGKKVPDTQDQYYVRNADQDVAYVVNLKPEHLTTRFEDWIEKDLLELNPLDIHRLHIKDYTAELVGTLQGIGVKWDRRSEMQLRYDDAESKWVAERLQSYDAGNKEMVDFSLAEDQELDEEALQKLRYGLDDLTIVDVERKPVGLSADLKAGSVLLKDQEALESLMLRGFAPLQGEGENEFDILSSEGEIVCSLSDGVEYVLRFGNLQMESEDGAAPQKTTSDDPNGTSDDGIHRYLFVMARVNKDLIEQPKLEELPALPEGAAEGEAEPSDNEDASAGTATSDNADEETTATADAEGEEQDKTAEDSETEEKADNADGKESELETLIAERKRIEEKNERRKEEYQKKVEVAEQRVKELNERFGDWYYVIDNKVYKQIHVGRNDIIKTKEKAEEKTGAETGAPGAPGAGLPGLPNLPANQ